MYYSFDGKKGRIGSVYSPLKDILNLLILNAEKNCELI